MKMLKYTSVALAFAFAACGTSAETERKLAELETANAQKDSLMQALKQSLGAEKAEEKEKPAKRRKVAGKR